VVSKPAAGGRTPKNGVATQSLIQHRFYFLSVHPGFFEMYAHPAVGGTALSKMLHIDSYGVLRLEAYIGL
jgi:hypothetical protein